MSVDIELLEMLEWLVRAGEPGPALVSSDAVPTQCQGDQVRTVLGQDRNVDLATVATIAEES